MPEKIPSVCVATTVPPLVKGRDTRLAPGLVRFEAVPGVGSISREDRKDVFSKSDLRLVIVRKLSRSAFCSARGVPFRSRIYEARINIDCRPLSILNRPFGSLRKTRLR